MARERRKESATGYYHVMMRGMNREFLFRLDVDKLRFLEIVKEQQATGLIELVAWCLMNNHVHMIVKAKVTALSKAVKILSLKYSAYYNRGQRRIGPVFGDRFRSENIEDDSYLLGALRYIHMNPVKAQLVNDPASYEWSSFGEYVGESMYIDQGQKAFVLGLFGENMTSFAKFHAQADDSRYLETREDAEKYRDELAAKVLEGFCNELGVTSAKEIQSSPELFEEISRRLVKDAGLSFRKAAELLETTHNRVYQALQDE